MGRLVRGLIAGGLAVAAVGAITVIQVRDADASARRAGQCSAVKSIEDQYASTRASEATADPYIAVLGDSYTQGQYLVDPLAAFPYLAAGDRSVLVDGSGGSGYVSAGPCNDALIIDRLDDALSTEPEVLVLAAGLNDAGKPGVRAAVDEVLDRAATVSPSTRIVVLGAFDPPGADTTKVAAVTAAIQDSAVAHGVDFVNPSGWDFATLEDGLHPSAEGHELIGGRLAASLGF